MVRYSGASWFGSKNIPYADVDYDSTMWRPDLRPLPCRHDFDVTTEEDGRHTFAAVADTTPADTKLDISLCVKVSLIVVDQFLLWDFVIIDPSTQTVGVSKDAEVC